MGTRCGTVIRDRNNDIIAFVYRQFDGYPSVHGEELKEILNKPVINGIGRNPGFNGMGEVAAVVIQQLKNKYTEGNIYVYPPDRYQTMDFLDYTYEVLPPNSDTDDNSPRIICRDYSGDVVGL